MEKIYFEILSFVLYLVDCAVELNGHLPTVDGTLDVCYNDGAQQLIECT